MESPPKQRRLTDMDVTQFHITPEELAAHRPPVVDSNRWLVGGTIVPWTGAVCDIFSPILDPAGRPIPIGTYPMTSETEARQALKAACDAYDSGTGTWTLSSVRTRIRCVEKFLSKLQEIRETIVNLIMWEICKNREDAGKEFDRTVTYIRETIKALKALENKNSTFIDEGGILAQIRHVPLGVCLCLGPFNYPFNETYTVLFPALLMGNSVILKTPRTGCMCHMPTIDLFRECFPAGVVNIIHGSGREVLPPLMDSGLIDIFAFIGTSKAAVDLQKLHPHPNRLRVCLGLDAKNPAIICKDANLSVAINECVLGSLSFNGQRCTALKMIYVAEEIADEFVRRFSEAVDKLKMGLPWRDGVQITPLPEPQKPAYLKELIDDAKSKGASVMNERGEYQYKTFVAPTVLYPVNETMRVFSEEQFGPLVPIVKFKDPSEVLKSQIHSSFGQQASVFTENPDTCAELLDILVNQVSRVNINVQCSRGPDSLPFTGRKNSACATLSISDALQTMSIRSVIALKNTSGNQQLAMDIMETHKSKYLHTDYVL